VVSLQHEANNVSVDSGDYVKAAFLAHDPKLEVKRSYAERMEKEAVKDLVREKKGILILDLDHTLFQVTMRRITHEVPGLETWSFDTELEHTGRLMEQKTYWFHLDSAPHANPFFLHLRPGMYSFLNFASAIFELYAYTQGTSEYAKKILGGIDPKGELFGTPFRLIARETDPVTGLTGRKNLSRVFPNEEGLVVIIDDRDDVWDTNACSQNLVKLCPFLFFPDKERERILNDALLAPRSDSNILSTIHDTQLSYLERLLGDLHAEVFFGSSQEESGGFYSFPSVLTPRRAKLFDNFLFVKNDKVNMSIFKLVKQFGGSFISLSDVTGNEEMTVVYLGTPDQERRKTDPELIHPWFVLFCVSTYSLPPSPDMFSLARIQEEQITNMWDCVAVENENGDADENDLLSDLLG
jgi:FCP1-like phosphatase family protein